MSQPSEYEDVIYGKVACKVTIDQSKLVVTPSAGKSKNGAQEYVWDEIYAVNMEHSDSNLVCIRYVRNVKDDFYKWKTSAITLQCQTPELAMDFCKTCLPYVAGTDPSGLIDRRHYLIFVNPVGGTKNGMKEYGRLKEMLDQSGVVTHELFVTEKALHAYEKVHTMDLSLYDGVVCVSGDGLVHEVVNGLLKRKDWAEARKMPIGIVPGGTGNAMHRSLEIMNTNVAALTLIKSNKIPMDIFSVTTADGVNYGHLEVFLGLLSDIDLESECVRWMGEIRLTLWCIVRLLSLRRENCTMSWLPIEKTSNDVAGNTTDEAQGYGPKRHFAGKELTADWTTEVMDFTTILLMNVPWISMDGWASPFASNDDGGLDLIYSNKGRPELQAMLLAEREPYAANHPDDYKFHKVKALKFEYTTLPEAGGKINVDGEDMGHHKSIEVESHRKLMSFLAPKSLVLPKYAWPPHNEMYPLAVRRPSDVSTVDP